MVRCKTIFFIGVIFVSIESTAQEPNEDIKNKITAQMKLLRKAHLQSDTSIADQLYHHELWLTSQSGKKYSKKEALINLTNHFETYEYSEIAFKQIAREVVMTNLINERKYKGYETGRFRLTMTWVIDERKWKIISMQSSRIKI